jgi:hypothetical protein
MRLDPEERVALLHRAREIEAGCPRRRQLGYESLGMTLVGRAGNGIKRNFKLLEVGLPLWPLSWRHRF